MGLRVRSALGPLGEVLALAVEFALMRCHSMPLLGPLWLTAVTALTAGRPPRQVCALGDGCELDVERAGGAFCARQGRNRAHAHRCRLCFCTRLPARSSRSAVLSISRFPLLPVVVPLAALVTALRQPTRPFLSALRRSDAESVPRWRDALRA